MSQILEQPAPKHGDDHLAVDTDQVLVEQCLNGDQLAWETLVRKYKRLVYHFPSQARLSSDLCDDVFQETFLALYHQLDSIENKADLSFWLSRVAQRLTWKCVTQHKTHHEELIESQPLADEMAPVDQDLIVAVQQYKIRKAIAQMPFQCRKLLLGLFYNPEEADYRQLAQEMGIAMGSIGPTRNRCLLKLKRILARMGIDEKNVSSWLRQTTH